MIWDKEKIKSVLPHREPFIFIDEIIEIKDAEKVIALKHVLDDETYLEGHFPGNPLMPGVLMIEAMAQASIILYFTAKPEIVQSGPDYYLGKVKAEFFAPVLPGDTMIVETQSVKILDYAAITDAKVIVNNNIVAKANLIFSIQKK